MKIANAAFFDHQKGVKIIGSLFLAISMGAACASGELNPNLPPSGNFNLSNWQLDIPDAIATTIPTSRLAYGYTDTYFYTDPIDGSMTFWCPVTGGTTPHTIYPRSELREMLNPKNPAVNWSWSGTHTITATESVIQVPGTGNIVTLQIHGITTNGGDATPLVKMMYNRTHSSLVFFVHSSSDNNSSSIHYIFNGINIGDLFSAKMQVVDGVLDMTVNGTTQSYDFASADPNWKNLNFYFKAGDYTQDNVGASTEGGIVKIYSLHVAHEQFRK